jgi:hypothetical protein
MVEPKIPQWILDKWSEKYPDNMGNIAFTPPFMMCLDFDERGNLTHYGQYNGFWETLEYDDRDNLIYYEHSNGYWSKKEYDQNNNCTYLINSKGYELIRAYDSNDNCISYKDNKGYWYKREYDKDNNLISEINKYTNDPTARRVTIKKLGYKGTLLDIHLLADKEMSRPKDLYNIRLDDGSLGIIEEKDVDKCT